MSAEPEIVVLDGHPVNPGDLSWQPLHDLGRCVIHPRTAPEQVAARARTARVLLTNKVALGRAQLALLPALQYVGVMATGYDVVDVRAAAERNVVVTNVPAYGTPSVVQHVFALLFALTNRVAEHADAARAGRWSASGDFSYAEHALLELAGRTLGLVGYGRIGQAVARVALGLQMRVIVHTPRPTEVGASEVSFVTLGELLERADVVSLHCPLTEQTRGLIDAAALSRMKPGALLVNTARGGLIDERALAAALAAGTLAGAALDVLTDEPPAADHPLLHAPRCIVTPHIAWATRAARARLLRTAIANVEAFLRGSPQNVVSRG